MELAADPATNELTTTKSVTLSADSTSNVETTTKTVEPLIQSRPMCQQNKWAFAAHVPLARGEAVETSQMAQLTVNGATVNGATAYAAALHDAAVYGI